MKKFFKVFGIILITIILLMIISGFFVTKFVNLNTFKAIIVSQVKKTTGKTLTINGDISWSLYPVLGLDFKDATLSDLPTSDQPFVKADDVRVGVRLLPLLLRRLEVERFMVNGLQINWQDSKTGHQLKIDKLSFQAKDIRAGRLFPINLSFKMSGAQAINVQLAGKVIFTNDEIKISASSLILNGDTVTGDLDVIGINKISQFDLSNIMRPLYIKGELQSKKIRFASMDLHNAKLNLQGQNGIINAPLTANMYSGGLQVNTQINVQQTTPNIAVQYKYSNFNLASLASSMYGVKSISGTGNIWGNITTHSFSGSKVMSTLNGTTSFRLSNGVFQGVDVAYMIYQGRKFWYFIEDKLQKDRAGSDDVRRRAALASRKNTKQTRFDSVSGANKITNGVANGNLSISSPDIQGGGSGAIDLVKRYVNYRINVGLKGDLSDWAVPIIISGPFGNVKPQVDKAAINKMAQQMVQKAIQQRLQQQIKQNIQKLPIKIPKIF